MNLGPLRGFGGLGGQNFVCGVRRRLARAIAKTR